MAIVKNNPITEGASGKLGRRLVFRHMKDGRTIIATRPDYSNHKWTANQSTHHNRFQEATAFARVSSRTNPLYAELARGTTKNAYNLALSDWFHAPVIHDVTWLPDGIRVRVTDNVQVVRVLISISNEQGTIVHEGEATCIKDDVWEYRTSIEGKITIEASDFAGNVTQTVRDGQSYTEQ